MPMELPGQSTTRRLELGLLALIMVLYLVTAYAYATRTPAWQVPDEPAHYNYIRQVSETGNLPVIEPGDWNQDYQQQLLDSKFDASLTGNIDRIQYEDHQPPLYYLLQVPVYSLSDGDLEAMRVFSAILGLGVIVCVWVIGQRLFPNKPWIGLGAAAFVAFLPQRLAMMAGVNNDALAETLAAIVLLLVVYYLMAETVGWRLPVAMGLVVGLVFLTKTTVYYVGGIAGLAILWRWWIDKWPWRDALRQVVAYAIPALALGLIWWIHGLDVYGGTDFLGLQRHDEVVVGQPRTDWYIDNVYGGSQRVYLENYARTTFHSFWGQFGWMALPLQDRIYRLIQIGLVAMLIGLVISVIRHRSWRTWQARTWGLMALFGLSIVLVTGQFMIYNLTFVQFQGRYLYPALVPLALLVGLGFGGWTLLASRRYAWAGWLAIVPPFLLLILAWYALDQIIVPNL
jgi:4-amino-4-deoxy-L-arabinose transferase-like glycosyltransferase